MADAPHALRRRAAWAALSTLLDEDSLVEALWLQHDTMRGESISDIIAFIDAVGSRHLLDAPTRKRLYGSLFDAMRRPEGGLPADPWPLMQARRGPVAPAAPSPSAWATTQPDVLREPRPPVAPPPPAAVEPAPAPMPVPPEPPPAPPEPAAAAHQVVFGVLVSTLIDGVRQFHPRELAELLADCRARLDKVRMPSALRQAARDALLASNGRAWRLEGNPELLASLVHEVYIGACEALGPVDADQLLMAAVRRAEQLPEAREFPPSRLL